MSYPPQHPRAGNTFAAASSQMPGDQKSGSVRAARERLQLGQRGQVPEHDDRSPVASVVPSQYMATNGSGRPWEAPQYPASRRRLYDEEEDQYQPGPKESSWPLPVPESRFAARSTGPASQYPGENTPASPQFREPTYPQTFFDSSTDPSPQLLQPPMPAFNRRNDNYNPPPSYPPPPRTMPPPTSVPSESDSPGNGIPDFPLPSSQYQPGRRSINPGPPPAARRGLSSYYSQFSGVSPIPEETSETRGSVNSYASSNAIPSRMPAFYLEETPSDDEDGSAVDFDWRHEGERHDESQLVRKASLGQRRKPSLTTIKSGDVLRTVEPSRPAPRGASQAASIVDGQSILLDASSSDKSRGLNGSADNSPELPRSQFQAYDPRVEEVLGGLERGGTFDGESADVRRSRLGTLSDRVGARRPPSLNVKAVRDAEARGSLTSLPDLIKRATRLASNLDRGRTASRLGVDWMFNDGEKPPRPMNARMSGASSMSGMLASFPPPGLVTPGPIESRHGWSAADTPQSCDLKTSKEPKKRREVCGLGLNAFLLCVLVVVLLIAAAIVLPVVLIILPSRNKTTASTPLATTLQDCAAKLTCANGGVNVLQSNATCGCVCSNGFTGPTCEIASNVACTTVAVAGAKSASLGTQIAPLILAAQQNFSIPLDTTALLSLFAATNMTCTTENALITFPNLSNQKRTRNARRDQLAGSQGSKMRARILPREVTDSAIVSAASPSVKAASTSTVPITVSTGTPAPGTNTTAIKFAKVGVLFILQESRDLSMAISAQEQLQQYLASASKLGSTMSMAQNITLGEGYSIDLWHWTVTLSNSTIYGQGFNGTATGFNNGKKASPSPVPTSMSWPAG